MSLSTLLYKAEVRQGLVSRNAGVWLNMCWCTTQEVAEVLSISRLRGDVSESARKTADERFMQLHNGSMNIGDILTEVAVNRGVCGGAPSDSLQLAAALALEPLVTKGRWCEGNGFNDKVRVLDMLLGFLSDEAVMSSGNATHTGRVRVSLCLCLCQIITFESPTPYWNGVLSDCLASIVSDWSGSQYEMIDNDSEHIFKSFRHIVVLQLSELCASNTALWWYMVSTLSRCLVEGSSSFPVGDVRRHFSFSVVLRLMRRRPRVSDTHEGMRPADSFIFGPAFRQLIDGSLQQVVALAGSDRWSHVAVQQECRLLLDISSHLISNAEFAAQLFRCSVDLLVLAEPTAYDTIAASTLVAAVAARVDSALECMSGVLQAFPEVSLRFDAGEVTSKLLNCMAGAAAAARGDECDDDDDKEAELLGMLREDYVVPLGCAGGDTTSTAGAVLELLVEANPQQLSTIVDALCNCCSSAEGLLSLLRSAHWRAWAAALRCCCRVCEEGETSLIDRMPHVEDKLMLPLAQLLHESTESMVSVELIDLLSLCLVRTTQGALGCSFLALLDGVFHHCNSVFGLATGGTGIAARGGGSSQVALLSVSVYAVHRLLSRCGESVTSTLVAACDVQLWLERSLSVLASGGLLAVYCGAYAVKTLLSFAPRTASHYPALAAAAVDSACRHCGIPDASSLFAGLLTCLCDHKEGECALAGELLSVVAHHCQLATPHRSVLLRSTSDYVLRASKLCLEEKSRLQDGVESNTCQQCKVLQLVRCFPLITHFTVSDAPHDEATTRLLSSCFAASSSVLFVLDAIDDDVLADMGSSLIALFHASTGANRSCTTLSTVCTAMSVVGLVNPSFFNDGAVLSAVLTLFKKEVEVAPRKGMDYIGCCLPVALSCVRHPQQLSVIAGGDLTPAAARGVPVASAWLVMFGVWSSISPFADHFTSLYFLAAWHRLLLYAVSVRASDANRLDMLATSAPCCCVYALPSLHVKSLPARRLAGCSIAQCIAAGLSLVVVRGQRAAKSQMLDAEIRKPLYIARRYKALSGLTMHESGADIFLSMSVPEGASWLLQQMCDAGYEAEVNMAMLFAADC